MPARGAAGNSGAASARGARSGTAGGGRATGRREEPPESQVVQVLLPQGSADLRLASIDYDEGRLSLHQIKIGDSGEVALGPEATVALGSIGDAAHDGKVVLLRAGGPSGRVLLRLVFEDEGLAKTWAQALSLIGRAPAAGATGAPPAPPTGPCAPSAGQGTGSREMLCALILQQEEQVKLLETINRRKEEQLLQMQGGLEAALGKLQQGQVEYAQQQRILDSQQRVIEGLQSQLQVASAAEAACNMNAMNAAAGAAAATRAGATGPLAMAAAIAAESGAAGSRAPAARSASAGSRTAPETVSSQAQDDEEDESGDEDEIAEQQALLAKLQALEAEKGRFEEQLRAEQSEIASQLRELQGMMEALGLSGEQIDLGGGATDVG